MPRTPTVCAGSSLAVQSTRLRTKRRPRQRWLHSEWPAALGILALLVVPVILAVFAAFRFHQRSNSAPAVVSVESEPPASPSNSGSANTNPPESKPAAVRLIQSPSATSAASRQQTHQRRLDYWQSRQNWSEAGLRSILAAAPEVEFDGRITVSLLASPAAHKTHPLGDDAAAWKSVLRSMGL